MARVKFGRWAVIGAMTLSLGACGGDDGQAAGGGGAGGGSADAAGLEQAQAVADKATQTKRSRDDFGMPTESVKPGRHRVAVIASDLQASIATRDQARQMVEAAKAAGWETSQIFDGKSSQAEVSKYVQQAIVGDYDVIAYASALSLAGGSAVKEASDAGIVQIANNDLVTPEQNEQGIVGASPNAKRNGELLGAYITAKSKGKAKGVIFRNPEYTPAKNRIAGVQQGLKKYCSGCDFDVVEFPVADLGSMGFFTAEVSRRPAGEFDWAITPFDAAVVPMVGKAQQQGRDDIKPTGFDGEPAVVSAVRKGAAGATVAIPVGFEAWASIDLAARQLAKQDLWDAQDIPVLLATPDNTEGLGQFWEPGFDYRAEFRRLWGRSEQ